MKKRNQRELFVAVLLLDVFAMWTLVVSTIDVQDIGPHGSSVGLATLNEYVHDLTGVNMLLYTVTDWLGLVPILTALVFAVVGMSQLIGRKNIFKVDRNILALGIFYIIVITVYFFFEAVVVNYRPVLIDGYLEASYPSSTTMLVMCVMPTAIIQLKSRIKHIALRRCVIGLIVAFMVYMVLGRLISGVHWVTDIIGGILLSAGLVLMYDSLK